MISSKFKEDVKLQRSSSPSDSLSIVPDTNRIHKNIRFDLATSDSKPSMSVLVDNFTSPPDSARPKTYWPWIQGCVSREGITADLEAMKQAGLGGAFIFHLGNQLPIEGWVKFQSKEWWNLMHFTMSEGKRLGLELGFQNCPGYSTSGGPWIPVEKSMQKIVWRKQSFTGPSQLDTLILPPPVDPKWNYYRDIAVLAIPDQADVVSVSEIIDLSANMDANGRLNWKVPSGRWDILRLGHTTTGKTNSPAPSGAVGLECDKLDRGGLDAHFDSYVAKVLENAGETVGKSLRYVWIDSYEAGDQDWSPSFREEFNKRRGYDPILWLVTKTNPKIKVGNEEMTARFQYDFKQTIAELFADNYYGYMAERVHKYAGLKLGVEPHFGPFDIVTVGTRADAVAPEFWTNPILGWVTLKPVASSAHIAGIPLVCSEAFTGFPNDGRWRQDPYALKAIGDRAFCLGVNQFILHVSAHQPWTNVWPGMTMGWWGTQFGRTQTWWDKASAWTSYLTRCQYMLQQGRFIGDVCVLKSGGKSYQLNLPPGYDGDLCSEEIFLKDMIVVNGRLTLPSGMNYRVLVLPDSTILPTVARKIRELIKNGAVIVGPKPTSSPSLQDYPACDQEVKKIGAELWDSGKVISGKSLSQVLEDLNVKPDFESSAKNILWIHRRIGDSEVYFVSNQDTTERIVDCTFRVDDRQPELWDAATGEIRKARTFSSKDGVTKLPIKFDPRGSVFVVFHKPSQTVKIGSNWDEFQSISEITGSWKVRFDPRWGGPGQVTFDKLTDWSRHIKAGIRYFSGTAVYEKEFNIPEQAKGSRLFLDLGKVKNLAEVILNGQNLGITWKPPYRVEVTKAIHSGNNKLELRVTNLWPNRLIGDEQEQDDCTWEADQRIWKRHDDPQILVGWPLKEIPDWLTLGKPRPSAGRYTFTTWKFYSKDSPLMESGLLGPVRLLIKIDKP
jgi:hypothetical protein